jgi:hypothetical protein
MLLFECNARVLCKPRCVYLFKTEINILIGRSRPNQTEQHWLSSRLKTKCLNTALDGGLIYLPLYRDGADGGGDKWRSKGGCNVWRWRRSLSDVLITALPFEWRLRKTTRDVHTVKTTVRREREKVKRKYSQWLSGGSMLHHQFESHCWTKVEKHRPTFPYHCFLSVRMWQWGLQSIYTLIQPEDRDKTSLRNVE